MISDEPWNQVLTALYESAHRIAFQKLNPNERVKIIESHMNELHFSAFNFPNLVSKVRSPRSALSTVENRSQELNKKIDEFLDGPVDEISIYEFIEGLSEHNFQIHNPIVRQHIFKMINVKFHQTQGTMSNEKILNILNNYSTHVQSLSYDYFEDMIIDSEYVHRLLVPAEFPSNRCENPKVVDVQSAGSTVSKSHNSSMAKVIQDAIHSSANPDTGRYEYSFAMRQLLKDKFKEIDTDPPFGMIDKSEFEIFVRKWQEDHSIPIEDDWENEIEKTFTLLDEDKDGYISNEDLTKGKSQNLKNILRLSEEGNCRTCTFDRHEDCIRRDGHLNILAKYRPTSCEMRLDISSLQCGFHIILYTTLTDGISFRIKKIIMSKQMKQQFILLLKLKNFDSEMLEVINNSDLFQISDQINQLKVEIGFPPDEELSMKSSEDIWFRAGYRSKINTQNSKKTKKNRVGNKFSIVEEIMKTVENCCNPLRFIDFENLYLSNNADIFSKSEQKNWPILYSSCSSETIRQFELILKQKGGSPFPYPILENENKNNSFTVFIDPLALWR